MKSLMQRGSPGSAEYSGDSPPKPGTFIVDGTEAQFVPKRYREFMVSTGPVILARYSGVDMVATDVVKRRAEAMAEAYAEDGASVHPATFVGSWGHEVVWEGNEVVAILDACYGDAGPYLTVVWVVGNERLYDCRLPVGEIGWDRPGGRRKAKGGAR
jgi:hypothetical protein